MEVMMSAVFKVFNCFLTVSMFSLTSVCEHNEYQCKCENKGVYKSVYPLCGEAVRLGGGAEDA